MLRKKTVTLKLYSQRTVLILIYMTTSLLNEYKPPYLNLNKSPKQRLLMHTPPMNYLYKYEFKEKCKPP
jgi:hypothetical protein